MSTSFRSRLKVERGYGDRALLWSCTDSLRRPRRVRPALRASFSADVETFCRRHGLRIALRDFLRLVREFLPVVGRTKVRIQQDDESEACWLVVAARLRGPAREALVAYDAYLTHSTSRMSEGARSMVRLSIEVV